MSKLKRLSLQIDIPYPSLGTQWRVWLPSRGNMLFTMLIASILFWVQSAGALPSLSALSNTGVNVVNYQGELADSDGTALDGSYTISFALYDAATGGNLVWGPESHAVVAIVRGKFDVGLGSQTAGGLPASLWNADRYLEITIEGEMLSPRDEVRHVPVVQLALSVADNSITQLQAPFAPKVYHKDAYGNFESVSSPIIFTGWFHGSDEGYQVHDLSHVFSQIDAVIVTKTRFSNGNSNQVNYMVTDASGIRTPTPSEIMIHALGDDGNYKAWNQAYFIVYGR
ncbi:MAG: hypothetical protein ACPG8W_09030 [Candidatus Promineifilaceae bacterium]